MFKKNVLSLGLTSLLVTSTALATALDEQLYNNINAVVESKNYDSVHSNDDGSVTIINPKFGAADGNIRQISNKSDLNGLCKLYGFGPAVSTGTLSSGDLADRTVVINKDALFQQFATFNSSSNNSKIDSLMCLHTRPSSVSTKYEKIFLNDDGSITIRNPYFGRADGSNRYISAKSSLDGLCQLYGFQSAIAAGMISSGDLSDRTIVINSYAKFERFSNFNSSSNNSKIDNLMCTNGAVPTAANDYNTPSNQPRTKSNSNAATSSSVAVSNANVETTVIVNANTTRNNVEDGTPTYRDLMATPAQRVNNEVQDRLNGGGSSPSLKDIMSTPSQRVNNEVKRRLGQ